MTTPNTLPTLLSWGRGADSTAIIVGFLEDPTAYGLRADLSDLTIVTACTGDEWPAVDDLAERLVLPLLRRANVRLVQIARGGPSDTDGIVVLDDSRQPYRLHRRGPWALSDELRTSGTVPQFAQGRRTCSIKFKGWPLDRWAAAEFGGAPYRHVIGYEYDEQQRADRDETYTGTGRVPWYPLIEWGWTRRHVQRYLRAELGIAEYPKSYCAECCFPESADSLPAHLGRLREYPELAAAVLVMERVAMSLNPNSTLFKNRSLLGLIEEDDNAAALAQFERELTSGESAVYDVRRIVFPRRTTWCRERHGKSCRTPGADCRDPEAKGVAWRSVRQVFVGSPDAAAARLHASAAERGRPVTTKDGISRVQYAERGRLYPTYEGFLVAAPAVVRDKQRAGFEQAWDDATGKPRLRLLGL
ncbi:hypothetical protein [Kitasatospora sp. NPDC088548]|uniref:hypothetical protein n=1 Tax=Kitasatospora sp. NPDC088548 TaxID=3364075 RepID=UPI0037F13090